MKNFFTNIFLFLFPFSLISQTIVSTSPENKNVVLEEFTGIHCGYCPEGHAIAKKIQDAHPDDVVLINIHVGGYAEPYPGEPDFRTQFGSAIANQSNLSGYPSGTVNRHYFSSHTMNGGTAMSREDWSFAANSILSETSYVNLAIESSINEETRELTVHIEVYYTGDSPENTNKLNVVLLQNNTNGPQSGGGAGSNYVHMHRLVHMLTGQWGEDITTTTSGSFIDKTYTYEIPESYKKIETVLGDLEVVAFISEGQQEIITGTVVPASKTITTVTKINTATIFSIFPNPSKGEVNINFTLNSTEHLTLKVFDNSGKLIKSENQGVYPPGTHRINYQINLKTGVYFIELSGEKYMNKQKIIVNN